jgi:hypothetical protein
MYVSHTLNFFYVCFCADIKNKIFLKKYIFNIFLNKKHFKKQLLPQ